jgi:hypothetical protein
MLSTDFIEIMFLCLAAVAFIAFINLDRLLKIEYIKHNTEWIKDGKPRGIFWKPAEISWYTFANSFAMQKLSIKWLFKTPEWIAGDVETKGYLRKLRFCTLIWSVGIIIWFILGIIVHQVG